MTKLALRREVGNRLHRGREAGNRAGAQVVAVGKAAGQDYAVIRRKIGVFVPDIFDGLAEYIVQHIEAIDIAPSAGEDDNAELHAYRLRSV